VSATGDQKAASDKSAGLKPFSNIFEFLFRAPLYERYSFDHENRQLQGLLSREFTVDGHCPFCNRQSTFVRVEGGISKEAWAKLAARQIEYVRDYVIACVRDDNHRISFNIRAIDRVIQKVGQFPSFADIANDESKKYRNLLSKEDAAELHKAIGLAAHGVGIGAYVYIRRIFERLIHSRFAEWKDRDGQKKTFRNSE
jgi:hypothetical protein